MKVKPGATSRRRICRSGAALARSILRRSTPAPPMWPSTAISSTICILIFTRPAIMGRGGQSWGREFRTQHLFALCEKIIYVSLNDGENWRPLKLNLPTTPLHDLIIKDNDLVVGTHGRAFWILD